MERERKQPVRSLSLAVLVTLICFGCREPMVRCTSDEQCIAQHPDEAKVREIICDPHYGFCISGREHGLDGGSPEHALDGGTLEAATWDQTNWNAATWQ